MKYTKGPWKIVEDNSAQTIDIGISGYNADSYDNKGMIAWISKTNLIDNPMNNAHLIAAAPDMYEALKTISLPCIGTDENNDTCGVTFTCYNCRKMSKIALILAKAEGK